MSKRKVKSNNDISAHVEAFASAAFKHDERFNVLLAIETDKMGTTEAKEHKAAMLAEKNRATRCSMFADMLHNESIAAVFARHELTADAVQRLQIYAQDKLAATLRALAADCALSAIRAGNHSNMMTQRLVAVLQKDESVTIANAPRRMHDLFPDKSMGTYSAQASSSRQVLDMLGMLSFDTLTRAFSLSDTGKDALRVISA